MASNSEQYTQIFEEYVGLIGERQIVLDSHVSGLEWDLEPRNELLLVGDMYRIIVQVLGTYTLDTGEWLWVWGNEMFTYPDSIKEDSLRLKAYGEKHGLAKLVAPTTVMTEDEVRELGVVTVGITGNSFYYMASYGTGFALLAARSTLIDLTVPDHKVVTFFPRILSRFVINNHKNAFAHYVGKKGFTVEKGACVTASKDGLVITACFDASNRLVNLSGGKTNSM